MDFILDPSLVLYLPLGELDGASFMSKDAYGHLCTATGALWTPQGRSFDGVDDKITIPDISALRFGTGDFSIEVWSRHATDAVDYSVLIQKGTVGTGTGEWVIRDLVTNIEFHANGALWFNIYPSKTGIIRHAVVTRSGGTAYAYADGEQTSTKTGVDSVNLNTTASLLIGSRGTDRYWKDLVGEVRIYNRALSAGEIQQIYLATKWRYQ